MCIFRSVTDEHLKNEAQRCTLGYPITSFEDPEGGASQERAGAQAP